MPAEHYRPDGKLAQGYFCSICGQSGLSLYGTGHDYLTCVPNPDLVQQLYKANRDKNPVFRVKAVSQKVKNEG